MSFVHCAFVTSGLLCADIKSSIIRGHDVVRGDWPWMVYLNVSADRFIKFRCGGSLLNQEWVLTSARCLDRYRLELFMWWFAKCIAASCDDGRTTTP